MQLTKSQLRKIIKEELELPQDPSEALAYISTLLEEAHNLQFSHSETMGTVGDALTAINQAMDLEDEAWLDG